MSVLGAPWPIALAGFLSLAIMACQSPDRTIEADSSTDVRPEAGVGTSTPIVDCVRPSNPYLTDGAAFEADCSPADALLGGIGDALPPGSEPLPGGPPGVLLLEEVVGLSGGVFLSRDGSVHLLFPQGAVPSDSTVRVTRVDTIAYSPPKPPLGTRAGETVLYVGLTTLDGRPVLVLLRDAEMCVRYTAGDLDAGDGEASRLILGRFDDGSLRWDVPRNKLDDGEGMACATTLRFSVWTFFAESGDGGWPGLGWWWILVIGGGIIAAGGGPMVWLARRRSPITPHDRPAPAQENTVSEPSVIESTVIPPRQDPRDSPLNEAPEDQAPDQESESAIIEGEVAETTERARVDYAGRASATLQALQGHNIRASANIASVLGTQPSQDIPSMLDSVLNDIRASSLDARTALLQMVVSTSARGERAYDKEIDQVVRAFPADATTSLLSALRAFRMSRYVATRAMHNPLSLFDAPAIADDGDGPAGRLRLSGEVSALRGRVCSIDGVSVVLPEDPGLLHHLRAGQSVSVEGVLGRQATIFASRVQRELVRA